jgi:hypothetical protein
LQCNGNMESNDADYLELGPFLFLLN